VPIDVSARAFHGNNWLSAYLFFPSHRHICRVFYFKLVEEGNTSLLLHLLKVFAETAVLDSAFGLGCRLVVAIAQAVHLRIDSYDKKSN
jgi:hypothetical protein